MSTGNPSELIVKVEKALRRWHRTEGRRFLSKPQVQVLINFVVKGLGLDQVTENPNSATHQTITAAFLEDFAATVIIWHDEIGKQFMTLPQSYHILRVGLQYLNANKATGGVVE